MSIGSEVDRHPIVTVAIRFFGVMRSGLARYKKPFLTTIPTAITVGAADQRGFRRTAVTGILVDIYAANLRVGDARRANATNSCCGDGQLAQDFFIMLSPMTPQ